MKRFFRYEVIAVVATAMLISHTKPKVEELSTVTKLAHWAVLIVYTLVAVSGFRYLLMFLFRRDDFLDACSQLRVFGVDPVFARFLGVLFAVAGTVFFFAVMELGNFRRRARTLFSHLVFPCSFLYPVMTMGAAGGLEGFAAIPIAWVTAIVLGIGGALKHRILPFQSEFLVQMTRFPV